MELKDLCMRADTFPEGGPHVRRLAVSLQALEVCASEHSRSGARVSPWV